jgi:hypothetical protein
MDKRIADMYAEEQAANPARDLKSELDADTLRSIMVANDNSEGLFTPDPEVDDDGEIKPINEPIDEEAQVSTGKVTQKFGDYIKTFQQDLVDNPGNYRITTPEGDMSINEAMKRGYDPATQSFGAPEVQADMEGQLAGLPPEEAEAIRAMTNPNRANEEAPVPMPEGLPDEGLPTEGMPPELMQQAGAGGPEAQPQPGGASGIEALLGGGGM